MFYWKVWLNMEPSNFPKHMIQPIGKNTWYNGPNENIWKTESVTIIGYAKIYNEESLWKLIGKKKTETDTPNPMEIIVELYKIHGFETTLNYLDGDFGFVLLDYNIFGEEARLFIAKDPFGIFPLYKIEYNDSYYKKVQFVTTDKNNIYEYTEYSPIPETGSSPLHIEIPSPLGSPTKNQKIKYVFSNDNMGFCDAFVESIPNGTFGTFSHSYKISANWKKYLTNQLFYDLPFQSTYSYKKTKISPEIMNENRIEEHIKNAVEKRVEWIRYSSESQNLPKIGVLQIDKDKPGGQRRIPNIYLEAILENPTCEIDIRLFPEIDNNQEAEEEKKKEKDSVEMIYLEMKYPSLLQEIKTKINSNDPGIIRAHYIPAIVAKHIVEKYPGTKVIFMGEAFTYEYLEMDMFERRKFLKNQYFLEKIRGWTETFLLYGLELYMPFLDRMLIQTPDQYVCV